MSIKKNKSWQPWSFSNSRMKKSLPEDIVPKAPLLEEDEMFASFLLSAAMTFNDFKGLIILHDTIQDVYETTSPPTVDENAGEKGGIRLQLLKLMYATLHESLVFIRDSDSVFELSSFKKLLPKTPDETKLAWEMLRQVSNKDLVSESMVKRFKHLPVLLVKVRNNVGFHYQTRKQLLDGYRRFFEVGLPSASEESRKWAYRSVAREFSDSRYYYADAALQGYYGNLIGSEELTQEMTDEVFNLVNLLVYSIHDLLAHHHDSLAAR